VNNICVNPLDYVTKDVKGAVDIPKPDGNINLPQDIDYEGMVN